MLYWASCFTSFGLEAIILIVSLATHSDIELRSMKSKFEHVTFWHSLGVLGFSQGLTQVFGV